MTWPAKRKALLKDVIIPAKLKLSRIPKVSRPEKAIRAINFIQTLCTHTKGKWAGSAFRLLDWQWLLIWRLFGTCKKNGFRQYRKAYVEIPKKNGKSELAAAIALILLCGDDEIGAEVYSAASDTDQASLVYDVAAQMVRQNKILKRRLKVIDSRRRIVDPKTNSFYRVLSAEVETKHGLNPHGIIFDELHAQPNSHLWDVLTEGTDYARSQQLIFAVTTAGIYDQNNVCWREREHARQVAEGTIIDDTTLPVIYSGDRDKDDWQDPKVWKRLNPSIGQIFDIDKIKTDAELVKQQPHRLNNFLRFRLNMWVNQISRWMPMDHWDACDLRFNSIDLIGRHCYGGLDLSSVNDLTSLVLVFPPISEGETWKALSHFFIPEDNITERARTDRVPYDMWRRAGYMTATPGNAIDYSFIRKYISGHMPGTKEKWANCIDNLYRVDEIAFDRWGAEKIATELAETDGINMVRYGQGYKDMSGPTKYLLSLVLRHEINFGKNPVLRWCADNMVIRVDAAENIKPDKEKARERIDGVVALVMALGRASLHFDSISVYEERGLRTL